MASGFQRTFTETYVITVRAIGQGRKIIDKKTFTDYTEAMLYCSVAESKYYDKYTVEFDTKFGK